MSWLEGAAISLAENSPLLFVVIAVFILVTIMYKSGLKSMQKMYKNTIEQIQKAYGDSLAQMSNTVKELSKKVSKSTDSQ